MLVLKIHFNIQFYNFHNLEIFEYSDSTIYIQKILS